MTPVATWLLAASLASPSQASTCTSWDDEPGVLWTGRVSLSLPQVAELAAPILWFTRDEPLIREGVAVPAPHPCDAPAEGAVVYYQVTELVRSGPPLPLPLEDNAVLFDQIDHLVLKYFFYYPRDYGLGGHTHDLEAVELHLFLQERDGCFRVRMDSAEALAHGSRWYSNLLDIEPDTRFPLTVFVEEGKHASACDRNADGRFTRGYDVNRQVNDAWGVRDVMGAGVLLTSAYNAEMTKPRIEAFRVFPPPSPLLQVDPARSSTELSEDHLYRYELRPGDRVPTCSNMGEDRERLVSMMRYHGFGQDAEPEQYSPLAAGLKNVKSPQRWLSFSARFDDNLGLGLVFRGLDITQGWILPKLTVSDTDYSASLLFTPSASRFADYYVSGGVRRQFKPVERTVTIETEGGRREIALIDPPQWNFTTEVGVKLRARIPAKARWAVLGYQFGGVRLGVQALGFGSLDDIRLIFEIGAGAF